MNKRKILNDPVYGFITIPSDLLFDLIEHRYFQRLRRIKQVGLTHYVYPGALHTRFQHAIGAMHLMGQAVQILRLKGHPISEAEEEASLAAILLHDIGHGPYSHALELLLLPLPHEDLTLRFMKKLNEEFEGRLSMAIDIFNGTYPKTFLTQLVSGQLDMDRLDYLKRDSFFTGVAEGVIGYDRIISMLNVVNNEIVVEEKGLYSIEKFLVARRLMYLQVYLHKAVISAEQMIRRVITLLPQHLETTQHIVPKGLARLLTDENRMAATSEMIETFASLDDVEIDFTLKCLQTSEISVLRILSGGLIQRRLFRTVFSDHLFPLAEVQQTVAEVANLLNLSKAEASQLVLTGRESVPTYDPEQGEIRILRKDGKVIDLPELLEDHAHPKTFNRYFLCYPVKA